VGDGEISNSGESYWGSLDRVTANFAGRGGGSKRVIPERKSRESLRGGKMKSKRGIDWGEGEAGRRDFWRCRGQIITVREKGTKLNGKKEECVDIQNQRPTKRWERSFRTKIRAAGLVLERKNSLRKKKHNGKRGHQKGEKNVTFGDSAAEPSMSSH